MPTLTHRDFNTIVSTIANSWGLRTEEPFLPANLHPVGRPRRRGHTHPCRRWDEDLLRELELLAYATRQSQVPEIHRRLAVAIKARITGSRRGTGTKFVRADDITKVRKEFVNVPVSRVSALFINQSLIVDATMAGTEHEDTEDTEDQDVEDSEFTESEQEEDEEGDKDEDDQITFAGVGTSGRRWRSAGRGISPLFEEEFGGTAIENLDDDSAPIMTSTPRQPAGIANDVTDRSTDDEDELASVSKTEKPKALNDRRRPARRPSKDPDVNSMDFTEEEQPTVVSRSSPRGSHSGSLGERVPPALRRPTATDELRQAVRTALRNGGTSGRPIFSNIKNLSDAAAEHTIMPAEDEDEENTPRNRRQQRPSQPIMRRNSPDHRSPGSFAQLLDQEHAELNQGRRGLNIAVQSSNLQTQIRGQREASHHSPAQPEQPKHSNNDNSIRPSRQSPHISPTPPSSQRPRQSRTPSRHPSLPSTLTPSPRPTPQPSRAPSLRTSPPPPQRARQPSPPLLHLEPGFEALSMADKRIYLGLQQKLNANKRNHYAALEWEEAARTEQEAARAKRKRCDVVQTELEVEGFWADRPDVDRRKRVRRD